MKRVKYLLLALFFTLSFICPPVLATNRITLAEFLEGQGFSVVNATVRIVTNKDDTQHIEIIREIRSGEYEFSMISCVEKTADGLYNRKIVQDTPLDSKITIYPNTRTSKSMVEAIDNTGLTVTVTAYYTSVFAYPMVLYTPSGVTGKVHRTSGTNTVAKFTGYFTIPGELVFSDYTPSGVSFPYEAKFIQPSPAWNVIYSDYQLLPSGYSYIDAIPPSDYDSPGLGYILEVVGEDDPYEYSIYPFNG